MGFYHIVQAHLKLLISGDLPASASRYAGITGVSHHARTVFSLKTQVCFNIHKSISVIHYISKIKSKNSVVTSIDEEKVLDKIQHDCMIKTLNKICIVRF